MAAASPHSRMSDVADRAGVSLSTVSRALRGAPGVAPEVRERVQRAAAELSYVVSRNASGLVTGATGRVAVLVPFLQPWFFGVALAGIGTRLRQADLDMLVYQVGDMRGVEEYLGELPLRRNVDAVIALSLDLDEREIAVLDEVGVPVVFVSQRIPERASVFIDNAAAARSATRHLLNLGHTSIAFVQSADSTGFEWSSAERVNGYREAMAEAGVRPQVLVGESGPRGGALAAGELLSRAEPPTAIFAESDDVAMGVLRVLQRSGLAVPEVMSVLGFDNHDMAELLDLSTVAQPVSEMGAVAARLAVEAVADPAAVPHVELATNLLVRGSTAGPRAASRLVGGNE
ncbi:LacI family DNA-binding transcriptional regulator [Saccharopolyspora erythraea]|nr:LacI family DNA-binding transcriptional regulator [Saccharopolyspora erythraea]QRK89038.1 LacI family DNA-binding transcriptional regulator [Saccharopolyspora erythraea]